MTTRKYTDDHDWVTIERDIATVGITDHAQEQLGDIVFVELPGVGDEVTKGENAAVVESVKAASDIVSPVSGEVVEINDGLESDPATVNSDAFVGGWFFKVKLSAPGELDELLDQAAYDELIA